MRLSQLPGRPKATTIPVEDLLAHVCAGQLRVPRFQRDLKWRTKHTLALFDSIYRGFPIGSLLLAVMPGAAERLKFGPLTIEAEEREDAWFIIDGQQRVTTMAGALLHPDEAPFADVFALWFDLENETFVRRTDAEEHLAWIPLNLLSDTVRLLNWLNDWPLQKERPDLVERAFKLSKAIREYQLPIYLLDGSDEETLRLIFSRVNTAGVAMEADEVFTALYGGGEKPLQAATGRLSQTGFGAIKPKDFLRAAKISNDAKRASAAGDLDSVALEAAESAMRRTIDFLQRHARIPHLRLLPYRLPLLVLPRFFKRHPEPGQRNLQLLARWVWRGALSREHAGSSDVAIRILGSQMDKDTSTAVQHLLSTVNEVGQPIDLTADWNTRSAQSKLFVLALLSFEPREPDGNGVTFDPPDWESLNRLAASPFEANSTALSERLLIKLDGQLVTNSLRSALVAKLQLASDEVLQSHCLTRPMVASLGAGDRDGFNTLRRALLNERIEAFFRVRAGLGLGDRPSISALLAS